MLKSLLASALGAGLAAGLLAGGLQLLLLAPLIGEAELYESGSVVHFAGTDAVTEDHVGSGHHDDAAATPQHEHPHTGEQSEATRAILTVVSTVAAYTGFALFLVAAFAMAERAGLGEVRAEQGVLWGLAGFAATQLAPAIGLAPELPGSIAAPLEDRQLWWLMTAALTAGGIAMLAGLGGPVRFLGLVPLVIPHLLGAPHAEGYFGVVPPELAAHFAARSLAVGAVAWLVLGWLAARLWSSETRST